MSEEQEKPQENQSQDPGQDANSLERPASSGYATPPPFQQPPPFGQFSGSLGMGQQHLPNATASLVLGIIALPACCFYGFFGLVFGVIAWILGAGDIKKYQLNPSLYTESSYKNAKAGKICGMIATILSLLFIAMIVLVIVGIVSNPAAFSKFFEGIK